MRIGSYEEQLVWARRSLFLPPLRMRLVLATPASSCSSSPLSTIQPRALSSSSCSIGCQSLSSDCSSSCSMAASSSSWAGSAGSSSKTASGSSSATWLSCSCSSSESEEVSMGSWGCARWEQERQARMRMMSRRSCSRYSMVQKQFIVKSNKYYLPMPLPLQQMPLSPMKNHSQNCTCEKVGAQLLILTGGLRWGGSVLY